MMTKDTVTVTQDVEMKDVTDVTAAAEEPKKDPDILTLEDIRQHVKHIEKAVSTKEPRFMSRALRVLVTLRKRLNSNVLRKAVITFAPTIGSAPAPGGASPASNSTGTPAPPARNQSWTILRSQWRVIPPQVRAPHVSAQLDPPPRLCSLRWTSTYIFSLLSTYWTNRTITLLWSVPIV